MDSRPGETVKEQPDEGVTAQEFGALVRELSNWNRWGSDDQRGALHFLTADGVAAAAGLVRDGVTVSLSLPLNTAPAIHCPVPADHHMTAPIDLDGAAEPVEFVKDYVGLDYHNDGHTHIDALCHVAYQGRLYNGRSGAAATDQGAAVDSIDVLKDGLVGRGVLLDIPRVRGMPWLERGQHVFAEDLEAAGREQRVSVGEGDNLLVRTGHFEDLTSACERARCWEFLFIAAPLRIVGGTGSPVNPLAVL